jgi:hypothetical protein
MHIEFEEWRGIRREGRVHMARKAEKQTLPPSSTRQGHLGFAQHELRARMRSDTPHPALLSPL